MGSTRLRPSSLRTGDLLTELPVMPRGQRGQGVTKGEALFRMSHSDLTVDAFLLLRDSFFDDGMQPIPFHLRPKRNTQDDPLDEYISSLLQQGLTDAVCHKAPGPLINPDLVLYRPELCNNQRRQDLANDTTKIAAVEVKKLERTAAGRIARATGLDYNTTPPCGTVRIYAADDSPLDIRGFYLFVAQEQLAADQFAITGLALCDGNILNEDFDLYLASVSQRQKKIDLGTYGDGVDRQRPMFIFSNPLGAQELDRHATLVSVELNSARLRPVFHIFRTISDADHRQFHAFRKVSDVPDGWKIRVLKDPFPQPNTRVSETQARGRFRLPVEVV